MNEKLEREFKSVFDHTKTLLASNVTNLFSNGKLKSLSADDMRTLLSIISATVDQSHFQTSNVFLKLVDESTMTSEKTTTPEKNKKK